MKKILMSILALTMAVSPMTLTTKAAESAIDNSGGNSLENTDENLNQGENNEDDASFDHYSYSISGYNKKYDDLLKARDYYDKNEEKFTVEYNGTTYEFFTDYLTGKYSLIPVGKSWEEVDKYVKIAPLNPSYDPNQMRSSLYDYDNNNIYISKSQCKYVQKHNYLPLPVNINNIDELKNNNNMAFFTLNNKEAGQTLFSYDIDKACEEKIDRSVLLTFLIELDKGYYPCYSRELTRDEIKTLVNWEEPYNQHSYDSQIQTCGYSELKSLTSIAKGELRYNSSSQYYGKLYIDKLTPKYQARAKDFYNQLVEAYNKVDITEDEIIDLLAKYLSEDTYLKLARHTFFTQEDLFENGMPKFWNFTFQERTSTSKEVHVYELIKSGRYLEDNSYCRDDHEYDTRTDQDYLLTDCNEWFYLGQGEEGDVTSTDNRWIGDALITTRAGLKHQLKVRLSDLLWGMEKKCFADKKVTVSLYYSESLEDKSKYDLLKTFDYDLSNYDYASDEAKELLLEWTQEVGKEEEYLIVTYDIYYDELDENGKPFVVTYTNVKDLRENRVKEIFKDVETALNEMRVGKIWSDELQKYTPVWTQESIDKVKNLTVDYQLDTIENMVKYFEEKYNALEYDQEFMTYKRFKDFLIDGNYYYTDFDGILKGLDNKFVSYNSTYMWSKPGLLPHQFEKIKYEIDRVEYTDIYTGESAGFDARYLFRCAEYGIDQAMTLNYILDNEQAFTPESFAPLKEALDKANSVNDSLAKGVNSNGLSSLDDVKVMGDIFKAVQKAYVQLEFVHIADPNFYGGDATTNPKNGFKAVYEESKEKFETVNKDLYTTESWNNFMEALTQATSLYDQVYKGTKILTDQAYMDEITDNLHLAINNLEINTDINKADTIKLLLDSLTTLINDKDLYTSATWNPINDELVAMQKDLSDNQDEITLETLSAYNLRFIEIRRSLILKYHHSELKALVNKFDSIANDTYDIEHNSKKYTYSYRSFAKFKPAYLEVRNKFDVDDINQAEAEKYYSALLDSVDLLSDLSITGPYGNSRYNILTLDALEEKYYEAVASNKYTQESLDTLKKVVFAPNGRRETIYDDNLYIDRVSIVIENVEICLERLVLKNPDEGNNQKPSTSIKNPFKDVKSDDWYYNVILEAYSKGIMLGTSESKFSPNGTMDRGMVATVMYRLAGSPNVKYQANFKDVKDGLWYSHAITYCYQNQIISGYNNGKYGPDDAITRQDLAVILYNYALKHGYNMNKKADLTNYSDCKKVSDYAKTAVSWAVANGIMGGGKTLNPTGNATRGECAKMFVMFDGLKK